MAISEQVGNIVGGFSGGFGAVAILIWAVLIIAVFGGGLFLFLYWKAYKYKIVIFEKVNGIYQPTIRDKARLFNLSNSGDVAFKLMKLKKTVPEPTIQTGKNTFWFARRQEDGELINIGLQDVDKKSKELGVHFLDKEMRYARTQLQRGLKERYDTPSFWQLHGAMIMNIAFIMIIAVAVWLIMDKWVELAGTLNGMVEAVPEIQKKQGEILLALQNVCSEGSGFTSLNP